MDLGCHGHGMALFSSHREEQPREGVEPGEATLASLGAQGKTQIRWLQVPWDLRTWTVSGVAQRPSR